MRKSFIYLSLFLAPAVFAAFGIRYLTRDKGFLLDRLKDYRSELSSSENGAKGDKVAKLDPHSRVEDTEESAHEGGTHPAEAGKMVAKDAAPDQTKNGSPAPAAHEPRVAPNTHEVPATAPVATAAKDGDGLCASVEVRGDGAQAIRYTEEEWVNLRTQFRQIKKDLLGWLEQNKGRFPAETAEHMEKQLRGLKIQRPPATEEPDLAWRGLAVWTRLDAEQPLIRVGGGFLKLVQQQPERAKFEIARVIAQTWAPCELPVKDAWNPVLGCLGVNPGESACAAGSYSESGWAVSTALASVVTSPGCTIPAFKALSVSACLKKSEGAAKPEKVAMAKPASAQESRQ